MAGDTANKFRTYDGIFLNTKAVVVEYHDIIKAPWYTLLQVCRRTKQFQVFERMKPLLGLTDDGLYEWYINRMHRNFFIDIFPYGTSEEKCDLFLKEIMNDPIMYYAPSNLRFAETLGLLIASKLVPTNKIFIYSEYSTPDMEKDLRNYYEDKFKLITGDFKQFVSTLPIDTTYVLSDIKKIYDLRDTNHLEFSSIILPIDFRYNKKNASEFLIDFDTEFKNITYKLNTFINCY